MSQIWGSKEKAKRMVEACERLYRAIGYLPGTLRKDLRAQLEKGYKAIAEEIVSTASEEMLREVFREEEEVSREEKEEEEV
jgi:hypothetical protein